MIFENLELAWEYIHQLEASKLNDGNWGNPPLLYAEYGPHYPIFIENIHNKPIPFDDLDCPIAGYCNNGSDDKFVMCRLKSGRYSLKPNLRHKRFLFRGQTAEYPTCIPTLFRGETAKLPITVNDRFIEEMMRGQEMIRLMISLPLVQLLDSGVVLNGRKVQFEMNLFGLTQHYYNKTTFIDLTSDESVASFFATCYYNNKLDEYYPKDSGVGVIYLYKLNGIDDFKPRLNRTNPTLTTIGLQVFPRSGIQRGFLYDLRENEDFAKLPEVTPILFKHNPSISQRYFNRFNGGKNLFPDDILSVHWKKQYHGCKRISSGTVRLNKKFNSGKKYTELRYKIRKKGYRVEEYNPEFTVEELKAYCQEMVNGGWIEWCQQIHIPGDTDGKMMADLMNLQNNPQYSWAFNPMLPRPKNFEEGIALKQYKC